MSVNKFVLFLVRPTKVLSFYKYSSLIDASRQQVKKYSSNKAVSDRRPDWNSALSEAEKIVGYPTSILSNRSPFDDEIPNVALHLQKLVGSKHPFLKTAEAYFIEENVTFHDYFGVNGMRWEVSRQVKPNKFSLILNGRNVQVWGLIVLLISKAAGHMNVEDTEEDKLAGILRSQRSLADITEMIHTSHMVHRSLVNIRPGDYPEQSELDDMTYGNKIALLSGDYLLVNSGAKLAALRNQDIMELMSSAIKDLAEAEFVGRSDNQDNPLPSVPPADRTGYAVKEWTLRNFLSAGALLGKSCKSTLMLAGHNEQMQQRGYTFGKHLALAWQAHLDLNPFISQDRNNQVNVCSAPVMFHIEHDPSILIEIDKGLESVENIDYARVYDIVVSGPGLELTKSLQREHSERAMEVLHVFQESDARTALSNIIAAMEDFGKTFDT